MQPHMDAPPRLPTLRTHGSFPHVHLQQAGHSEAARASQSPDSAKSARMAWHLLNRQAVIAEGQREPTAADVASSGLRPLQTRLSDATTASHARPQHMQHVQPVQRVASGAVTPARQPRVYGLSAGQRLAMAPHAALLPIGAGQKRKAAEQQLFKGHLDDLDGVDWEGTMVDLPNASAFDSSWGGSAGNSGSAAHAEEQQLGNMAGAQVPAFDQRLLPAAAAPAAGIQQPRKKHKTRHASSSSRAVHRAAAPAASPAQGSGQQVEQVVWGKSGEWPWWPATVSPNAP